jgi:Domain of unknown function (DUF1707)
MTEPGDERMAAAGGRGHMRVSRADREQVVELLKDAFVQDRLTQNELDTRVGQALASRTYADLAAVTADIPAGSAAAGPAGTPARTLARAARRSGICVLVSLALWGVIALTDAENLVGLAVLCGIAAAIAASGFLGYGVMDAWQQRRSRGQLPPRPGRAGQVPEVQQAGQPGQDPALPRDRPGQARADLRSDSSRPPRSHLRHHPHRIADVPAAGIASGG